MCVLSPAGEEHDLPRGQRRSGCSQRRRPVKKQHRDGEQQTHGPMCWAAGDVAYSSDDGGKLLTNRWISFLFVQMENGHCISKGWTQKHCGTIAHPGVVTHMVLVMCHFSLKQREKNHCCASKYCHPQKKKIKRSDMFLHSTVEIVGVSKTGIPQ